MGTTTPAAARLRGLPVPLTPFVGRRREVTAACDLLRQPGVRLLTLTGAGGTGKTRLAIRVAATLLDQHGDSAVAGRRPTDPDGAAFVALAPVAGPELVPSAIAHALDVVEAGDRPLTERLVEALRDSGALLVLDNFEHLLPAAPLLSDLLAACRRIKLLVTSRAALHLSGEQEYPVPPLALPPTRWTPGRPLPAPDALAAFEAVELFVQRSRAVRPEFRLTHANARAVAEICARLDGLPLAIELAASWVKVLGPEVLLARLGRRLALLTGGPRDAPERQQTLRNTIDWSHALLGAGAQALFARLGIFVGGWTLEAAEAVGDGGAGERGAGLGAAGGTVPPASGGEAVLDGLAELVDKSLVRRGESGAATWFVMLETVREFALERLAASGAAGDVGQRHAAHYLELAKRAEPELRGAQQAAWLDRLEREHGNVRQALDWYLERGGTGDADAAIQGMELAGALWRFWHVRGYLSEGRHRLVQLLDLPAPAAPPARFRAARAEATFGAGILAGHLGDFSACRAHFEAYLAQSRAASDEEGEAWGLYCLGETALFQDDSAAALTHVDQATALFRRLGTRAGLAWCQLARGMALVQQQDGAAARAALEESATIFGALGEERGRAVALSGQGTLADWQGDYATAAALCREALSTMWTIGGRPDIPALLESCAAVAAALAQPARAARLAGAAAALRRAVGIIWVQRFGVPLEDRLAAARQALGEAAFSAAWAAGQTMSMEEAVALALAPNEPASTPTDERAIAPAEPTAVARATGHPSAPAPPAWAPLTAREREVAAAVAEGMTNGEIAKRLVITRNTAGVHVVHILNKLGLRSRSQIAAWAAAHGLVDAL